MSLWTGLKTAAHRLTLAFALIAAPAAPAAAQSPGDQPGLTAFGTERALRDFLGLVIADLRRQEEEDEGNYDGPPPPPAPPPPPPPPPPHGSPTSAAPAPSGPGAPPALSITNNQIVGIDEGDIVKLRGETLVILRRGRLFTVSLAGGALRPVSQIDAFPPGVDAGRDWYDEMLIAGDRVVVIGYSYARAGTQVNRFRLDDEGRLAFEDSYQMRSTDYYSSRNYASRLIGSRLILYAPVAIDWDHQGDPLDLLPALRQWQPGAGGGQWRRIANSSQVYIPAALRDHRKAQIYMLHSVTSCDVAAPRLDCEATVVVGNIARTFFVSQNAVYLWVSHAWKEQPEHAANAFVYRIPFDHSRPSAVQARGSPMNQFSFGPDAARGALHVLVQAGGGGGDMMWAPEAARGDIALVSIPMAAFGNGDREVPLDRYQPLPSSEGLRSFHNRFVGDHLLYADTQIVGGGVLNVVSLADRGITTLRTPHVISRIDAIGPDAIVVGPGEKALGFTTIELDDGPARMGATFLLPDANEGETRSHAFFFRPDPGSADGSSGLLGLPVSRFLRQPDNRPPRLSAGILFLSRRDRRLAEAGQLNASTGQGNNADDGCVASCVDWYGNARPIFIGERIFALLGYELVEGIERSGRIGEVSRGSFAPAPRAATEQ